MISQKMIDRLDKLNIINEYETKTCAELSKEFGVSDSTISAYLRLKGVETRKAIRRKILRESAPLGKKFGLWTVVSDKVQTIKEINPESKSQDRTLYWQVQCECGHVDWKNSTHLKNGSSTRCKKCGNKNYISDNGEIIIESVILSKFKNVYNNAKNRKKVSKLDFDITPEYLNELYQNNHCCALSGLDLTIELDKTVNQQNISIDRIDSNIGYVKGNIQLVDKRINMMKGTLSNEEFIELCCKVAEHNGWSRCS